MSIFKSTLKPYVQRQINARQDLVKSPLRGAASEYIEKDDKLILFSAARNSFVRMASFVNFDGKIGNTSYSGDQLAAKYILEGGSLYRSSQTKDGESLYSMRSGIGTDRGSYGGLGNRQLGLRPMPGIESVNIKSKSAYGSLREATVKFYAWDKRQLEELEILFMRTGYAVLLEWGWSMYLNTSGTNKDEKKIDIGRVNLENYLGRGINPFDTKNTEEKIYADIEKLREQHSGNYDALLGKVKNFSYSLMPNGGYECTTILISMADVLESLKMNVVSTKDSDIQTAPAAAESKKFVDKFQSLFLPFIDNPKNCTFEQIIPDDLKKNYYINDYSTTDFDDDVYQISYSGGTNTSSEFQNQKRTYITFAYFIALLDSNFNIYNVENKTQKLINFEIPYPGYGKYGNGYCLASQDSISIDPTVCIIWNPLATLTSGDQVNGFRFDPIERVNDYLDSGYVINATGFTYYKSELKLGYIGNIYICVEHLISRFKELSSNPNSDGSVSMRHYLETILKDMSYALGSINEFGIFVNDSTAVIIDTHYVETADTKKEEKFLLNIYGTDTVVRNYNIQSKIFPNQSTMIAIGAQSRQNIGGMYSSTVAYLNKGLTDRLMVSKVESDERIVPSEEEYIKQLATQVRQLHKYVQAYTSGSGDLSRISSEVGVANTNLNNFILRVSNDLGYKAIIPLSAEITLDGIGGITQGEIFKINTDTLPSEYAQRGIGFIVTGIEDNIQSSDWTTTITTMVCVLDDEKQGAKVTVVDRKDLEKKIYEQVDILNTSEKQKIKEEDENLQKIYNDIVTFIEAMSKNLIYVNITSKTPYGKYLSDPNNVVNSLNENYLDYDSIGEVLKIITNSSFILNNYLNKEEIINIFKSIPTYRNSFFRLSNVQVTDPNNPRGVYNINTKQYLANPFIKDSNFNEFYELITKFVYNSKSYLEIKNTKYDNLLSEELQNFKESLKACNSALIKDTPTVFTRFLGQPVIVIKNTKLVENR